MNSIWESLDYPILALAPMEDVTDTVFRRIVGKHGRPDVFFTEFTSSDAICSQGKDSAFKRLLYTEEERPLIAQIWGVTPENYYESAKVIAQMGFDGIDINMGCPVRDIIKKGACSALIKTPDLAREIIEATRNGAPELPVSVKTRIGFSDIQTEEWIGFLLKLDLPVLTIHGRTVKEMSKYPVHWDEIERAVKLRDSLGLATKIIGNGDVLSYEESMDKVERHNLDGIMIGRGVFQNLCIFEKGKNFQDFTINQKLDVMAEHIHLYKETWNEKKSFNVLKKYFKIYISGFPGASEMRVKFMETTTPTEALELIKTLKQ